MTQRSILAGMNPTVIIKAGGSVTVKGHDSDQVMAASGSKWGLKVEKHSKAEIGRARCSGRRACVVRCTPEAAGWAGKDG